MASKEDRDLDTSMGMFEAAIKAKPVELNLPAIKSLVFAYDGSNQDETVRALVDKVAAATGATLAECKQAESASDILAVCQDKKADLLVVPAPFGRDIEVLKDESLGSVIDMLLQETPQPLLCVRQLLDTAALDAAFADVLLPVLDHDNSHTPQANWALKLVAAGGSVQLLGVTDRDVLDEAKQLLGDAIDPTILQAEALNRTVAADIGGLVAALQKYATEQNLEMDADVKMGRAIPMVLEQANARPRLLVLAGSREHTSAEYHHAADLLLGATGPVLVVY